MGRAQPGSGRSPRLSWSWRSTLAVDIADTGRGAAACAQGAETPPAWTRQPSVAVPVTHYPAGRIRRNLATSADTYRSRQRGIDQGGDGRMVAYLLQAPLAGRPDAADRDAEPGADLCVGDRRVFGEHGEQLLAGGGQAG